MMSASVLYPHSVSVRSSNNTPQPMKTPMNFILRLASCVLSSCVFLLPLSASADTNVAPTVTVISADMRPGTTLMDITYKITDSDDPTVKVRALAFVNGTRSFANVIRPVTWVEGTETSIGNAITTGVDHTLTWDVKADWSVDLGNIKVEILAQDGRSLLPLNSTTIPATADLTELTISTNIQNSSQVLDALFWLYASNNQELTLINGNLVGSTDSGIFFNTRLATGNSLSIYAVPFVFKQMNLDPAGSPDIGQSSLARAGTPDSRQWYATSRPYSGISILSAWGVNNSGECNIPNGLTDATAIACGEGHSLVLQSNGTVVAWGYNGRGECNVPAGLSNVTAIAAGYYNSLALRSDGTVVAWGDNGWGGLSTVPSGLTYVTAIASGYYHNMALKNDGTVIAWGDNSKGACDIPTGLSNVTGIAAGNGHSMALKSDGTVVVWGASPPFLSPSVPSGLSNVIAISAGSYHRLALKNDGTIVCWGSNNYGQCNVPSGLSGVISIAGGKNCSYALKSDGTITAWGYSGEGQCSIPDGTTGVTTIPPKCMGHGMALKKKAK
jgi:hypothetical protein